MQKNIKIEKRSYSLRKPFFYFLLQVILIWEFFWILTGNINITQGKGLELLACAIMISYFFIKTLRVFKRTPKDNAWTDTIKMQQYLNS